MDRTDNDHLHFAVLEYLGQLRDQTKDEDVSAQYTASIQCLESVFQLSLSNVSLKSKHSLFPQSLPSVFQKGLSEEEDEEFKKKFHLYIEKLNARKYFDVPADEYKIRFEKAKLKFKENYEKSIKSKKVEGGKEKEKEGEKEVVEKVVTEEDKAKAAGLKNQGNEKLQQGNFSEAVQLYSEAIGLVPSESIYYCNRAAALTHLQQHEKALEDCQKAIQIQPGYSKAHSRMGLAYFNLGKYQQSVESYKKALEFDPNNSQIKQALESAEQKLREQPVAQASSGPPSQPDFSALLNNPAISSMAQNFAQSMAAGGPPGGAAPGTPAEGAAPGGAGAEAGAEAGAGAPPPGMPDLSQLMQNPQLQQMGLSSLMSDPNMMSTMQQAMNNPAIQSMVQNLMQNPEGLNSLLGSLPQTPPPAPNSGQNSSGNSDPSPPPSNE
mmetsp:Transcript_72/g.148  ORF Transcript_72/g.148 Transcript_72/m.148 type:complete len:436 (+) Transcript_72:49-1356(+)|eukprot:CAMPEP_0201488430 /NCGR_PEP_ID=MMETSP0151_2-20130828/18164_1 /ASSEMBLY_ACC=CAM_ASM_000257 /TAXON_ID=200890 /ORGANISM="Paramoeba atlantica, Strain 621/1 / CCAP 1560/9" /LENGTH=435 /DNA_ID=CAMNT_0047873717 /DNA_START=41 /DNA_END=1348 /DNA_ORIENTATION=+